MSVCFDIETEGLPRETILGSVPPFDRETVKLGNRKDPESIMRYMETAEEDYYERFVERGALDARTGVILCIGIRDGGHITILEGKESLILESFWDLTLKLTNDPFLRLVGFNILRFDLPFLIRRSWHLGVKVPGHVFDGRYFHRQFVDLMNFYAFGNRDEMISLDHLARFLGLKPKTGNGAGFAALWHEDRPAAIQYLKHDLLLTAMIAERMGLG